MLKGCEIYVNGAPCPMCMSAIYWARIDHVFFGASLADATKAGFSDAFQYDDFKKPYEVQHRDHSRLGVREQPDSLPTWNNIADRHYY